MKYSPKGAAPEALTGWLDLANDEWTPTYDDLAGVPAAATHDALLAEQQHVCCYCGRSLSAARQDSHIEHFRPQSKYNAKSGNDLTLNYDNLLASCGPPSLAGARHLPRTCGDAKGNWFDEALHVAPWDQGCEARFGYGSSGAVVPATTTDSAAEEMIKVLKLREPSLAAERATIILDLEQAIAAARINQANVADEIASWEAAQAGCRRNFGHVAARYLQDVVW